VRRVRISLPSDILDFPSYGASMKAFWPLIRPPSDPVEEMHGFSEGGTSRHQLQRKRLERRSAAGARGLAAIHEGDERGGVRQCHSLSPILRYFSARVSCRISS